MMAKLAKIGVTNNSHLISNISYINPFLHARGLRPLHKTTWEGLHLVIITGHHPVVSAVSTPTDAANRAQLSHLLTRAANLKNMAEQDLSIDSWTNAILYKFSVIGVLTTKDLFQNLSDLNHRFLAHGHVKLSITTMQALRSPLLASDFLPGQV